MGKRMKRITAAVAAALAAFAVQATETITATGGAGGSGGMGGYGGMGGHGGSAGAIAGAQSGAGAVANGGDMNSRAYALGLAASVSAQTCYGSILGGLAVWESAPCVRHTQFRELVAVAPAQAAVEFLCQNVDQHRALTAAGYRCLTTPGPRGPVFQTGAEGDHGYGPYKPFQN